MLHRVPVELLLTVAAIATAGRVRSADRAFASQAHLASQRAAAIHDAHPVVLHVLGVHRGEVLLIAPISLQRLSHAIRLTLRQLKTQCLKRC
jgi:hypothetical protein